MKTTNMKKDLQKTRIRISNPSNFKFFCVVLEGCESVLVFTANSLYTSDLGGEIALYWQVSMAVRHI